MCYLRYLCLFAYGGGGVQHILCCISVLFFFVLCTLCCQFCGLSILIVTLVFSNVYLIRTVFILYWSVFDHEYNPLIRKFHDHNVLTSQ